MSEADTTEVQSEDAGGQAPQPEAQATTAEATASQTQTDPKGEAESVDGKETDESQEWLKNKGVDPNDPKAVAEAWRKAEQEFHKDRQGKSQLKDEASQVYRDTQDPLWTEVQQLRVRQNVNDFYAVHPDAREMDGQMAEIVKAKPYLAQDLEALYTLAKAGKLEADSKEAENRGREAAKQEIAKASTAGIPRGNASAAVEKSEDQERLERFSTW